MISLTKLVLGKEEVLAVKRVLISKRIAQGPIVLTLEKRFARLTGSRYAIATNSGTAALHTALYAVGITPGDQVITTPFTFIATVNAVSMCGAQPVFVDIDESTYMIDPTKIEAAITQKTKAIIAVNLYGQSANYEKILSIARKYKLVVVEDAAQSIGATYKKKQSGNLADISCFSFYATKNIMCGEGGMITTNNETYAKRAKMFRHHGQDEKVRYEYADLGYNYRLTDLQAAIALAQIKRLSTITKTRQKNAALLSKGLQNISGIVLPQVDKNSTHVYHQFTIRITKDCKLTRDQVKAYLLKQGIESAIYYPKPLYAFKHLGSQKIVLPVVERVCKEVLSLPIHPELKKSEIAKIVKTLKSI